MRLSVETPRPLLTAPHGQSIIILRCPCGSSNRSRGVHLHPDTMEKVSSYVQEPHAIILYENEYPPQNGAKNQRCGNFPPSQGTQVGEGSLLTGNQRLTNTGP